MTGFRETNFKALLMKTVYGKASRILLISFILAVIVSQTAHAGVRLDLGFAPLDPAEPVYPGSVVQIPIYLTNYYDGPTIIATSNEISYDSDYLTALAPSLGPQGQAAGKNITYTIAEPGKYVVAVFGVTNLNLNTPILEGIVAYARFTVKSTAPGGTYPLGNKPECTALDGSNIPETGIAGFIEVTGPVASTTTTVLPTTTIATTSTTTSAAGSTSTVPATTTMTSTTTTTASIEVCHVAIDPAGILVASTETVNFSAAADHTECGTPQPVWSVDSSVGSTIDENGIYTAGVNSFATDMADNVQVSDAVSNTSAAATVIVSALPVGALNLIAPASIFSFRGFLNLQLLLLGCEEGQFSAASRLSFNPSGDIQPLLVFAAGRFMLALVLVQPDVQGRYDVKVSSDSMMYLKKGILNVQVLGISSSSQNL
jgi:hypothetical protein